jgi:hypothetical protein
VPHPDQHLIRLRWDPGRSRRSRSLAPQTRPSLGVVQHRVSRHLRLRDEMAGGSRPVEFLTCVKVPVGAEGCRTLRSREGISFRSSQTRPACFAIPRVYVLRGDSQRFHGVDVRTAPLVFGEPLDSIGSGA